MTNVKPGSVVQITTGCHEGKTGLVVRIIEGIASVALHDKRTEKDPRPLAYNLDHLRPLVVLDLGDGEDYAAAAKALRGLAAHGKRLVEGYSFAVAIADQIEAQSKPPRIPEPGVWGVVEASEPFLSRRHFVRHPSKEGNKHHWIDSRTSVWTTWDALIDPVLIREGVE